MRHKATVLGACTCVFVAGLMFAYLILMLGGFTEVVPCGVF